MGLKRLCYAARRCHAFVAGLSRGRHLFVTMGAHSHADWGWWPNLPTSCFTTQSKVLCLMSASLLPITVDARDRGALIEALSSGVGGNWVATMSGDFASGGCVPLHDFGQGRGGGSADVPSSG